MNINNLSSFFLAAASASHINNFAHAQSYDEETKSAFFRSSMAMLGGTHLQSDPAIVEKITQLGDLPSVDGSRRTEECSRYDINLRDFPQWEMERGYWIGEYTFLGGDGQPNQSETWNYPYGDYRGFITGEVQGNAYRQRNVFLYPPQDPEVCDSNSDTVGNGNCGVNGNTKIFEADQSVAVCNSESRDGAIEGLFGGFFETKTELIGNKNALLYQVSYPAFAGGSLFQSQLTTLTENPETGDQYRTRSAQGFGQTGISSYSSYYRERKVTETEFFEELRKFIIQYNILDDDLCKWDGQGFEVIESGSIQTCIDHLNQSFDLAPACEDDPNFVSDNKNQGYTCEFVKQNDRRMNRLCRRADIQNACPVTCDVCPLPL